MHIGSRFLNFGHMYLWDFYLRYSWICPGGSGDIIPATKLDPLVEIKKRYINTAMAFGPLSNIIETKSFAESYDEVPKVVRDLMRSLGLKRKRPNDLKQSLAEIGITSISGGAIYQILMHQIECPIKDSRLIEELRTTPLAKLTDFLRELLVLREISKEIQGLLENFSEDKRVLLIDAYFNKEGDFVSELPNELTQTMTTIAPKLPLDPMFLAFVSDGNDSFVMPHSNIPSRLNVHDEIETEVLPVGLQQSLENIAKRFNLTPFTLIEEFMDQGQLQQDTLTLREIAAVINDKLERGEGSTIDPLFDEPLS